MPVSKNFYSTENPDIGVIESDKELSPTMSLNLGNDPKQALIKLNRIVELRSTLPGFDCGSCGSPTCRALAEDAVLGFAKIEDCIFSEQRDKAGLFNETENSRFKEHVE